MGWCAKDLTRPSPSTEGRRVRERWPASDFAASQGLPLGTSGGFPHSTGRGAAPPRDMASSSGFPARFLRHCEIPWLFGVRPKGIYGIFPGKVFVWHEEHCYGNSLQRDQTVNVSVASQSLFYTTVGHDAIFFYAREPRKMFTDVFLRGAES